MRIGLSSIVGDGFGSGVFVFGEILGEPPSFPPAGTILNTLTDQVYPIAQGGGSFNFNGDYPNQQADVYEKANGSGGSYIDWTNAFNIEFIPQYTYAFTDTNSPSDYGAVEVPSGSGVYYSPQYTYSQYNHDGNGSYEYYTETSPNNKPADTYITFAYDETFEITDLYYVYGTNFIVNTGRTANYKWSGNGLDYYTSSLEGNYYSYGNSIYSVANYTNVNGNDYQNGTGTDYVHNGSGFFTTIGTGQYYPSGWLIYTNYVNGTQNSIEVPSGSGMYNDSEEYGDAYVWDGTGNYTNVSSWYRPYGTYIVNYNGYDWYWDGLGGYFSM